MSQQIEYETINLNLSILKKITKKFIHLAYCLLFVFLYAGFCFAFYGFIFLYAKDNLPIIYDSFKLIHFFTAIFILCYIAFLLIQIVFNKDFLCCALLMLTIPVYLIVIFLIGKYVPNNIIFAFLLVLFVCAIINNNNKRKE